MRVLDLDLDYFLDHPVFGIDLREKKRVDDPECINSVWTEERVRLFLENNLGLSKNKKHKGRIVIGHDEALYFWEELINKHLLEPPFSVVHVDSHGDLGVGATGVFFSCNTVITWPVKNRIPRYCNIFDDGKINIANYLLFALAFRWISDLTYCANPKKVKADIPEEIFEDGVPYSNCNNKFISNIKLRSNGYETEPEIPFTMIATYDEVDYAGDFDFVSLAQSPNYTPENADFIIDIFREYIEEV